VLFNLTVKSGEYEEEGKEEERDQFVRLASILHDLPLSKARSCEKQYELHRYVVYCNYTMFTRMQDDRKLRQASECSICLEKSILVLISYS